MNVVTQEELDWLAEGGLDRAERQQLFDRLDQQSDGWKRCALALLEQKALQSVLSKKQYIDSDAAVTECSSSVTDLSFSTPSDSTPSSFNGWKSWSRLVLIAGLCFVVGYLLPPLNKPAESHIVLDSNDTSIANQKFKDRLTKDDPSAILAVSQALQRINVSDRKLVALVAIHHQDQELLLPVIESKLLSQRFLKMPGPSLPNNWSTQFSKAGWDLKPYREFLSLHLPDGTNEVLPVNLINCRFVGKPTL